MIINKFLKMLLISSTIFSANLGVAADKNIITEKNAKALKRTNYVVIKFKLPSVYFNGNFEETNYFTFEGIELSNIKVTEGNKKIEISKAINNTKSVTFLSLKGNYVLNIKGKIIRLTQGINGNVFINSQKIRRNLHIYFYSNGDIQYNKYLDIEGLDLPPNVTFPVF